jgi:ABC-type Na+ transport system ATPase subunit NatA
MVFNFESNSIGADWSNSGVSFQGYTIGEGMAFLIVDIVLCLTIGVYLSYVLPSTYGVPRKWYFLCDPSYWRKPTGKNQSEKIDTEEKTVIYQKNFEDLRSDAQIGVAIRHLRKVFSATETIAVADLSLNMYYGEIFALLGHNGAGKTTTISMLTGMYPPTSGDARLGDKWITSDMHEIRSKIGFCPQHDILYDDLTVREHLILYANIKCMKKEEIQPAVDQIIIDVGLEEKIHAQTRSLSGGQKRKLSVAIALLGDNKVVFLDEPTSGMDVFYRRHMWDLLKKKKKDKFNVSFDMKHYIKLNIVIQ